MKKKLLLLFALLFLLNLFWEVAHSPLYDWNPQMQDYAPHILAYSFMDAVYISLLFFILSLRNGNINWLNKPRKSDCIFIAVLGLILSMLIEIKAFYLDKWSYNSMMPQIFGLGLSPLLQLAITSLIAIWFVKNE
ncbi:MAG: hypothetical protein Q8Q31_06095 [Nanoarchaeota archaeon]|nr:hypothetical protein [Nanoarchaeota archaeon]